MYHHLQFLLGKNVQASDYDPVVETFFIDFNTIRIMSEVMVDYVSVSLFCCCIFCCLFFFIFGSFVPIRERILLQLFMYMREKNEIAFAHFENCFLHATNTFDVMHHVTLFHRVIDYVIYWQ